MTIKLLEPVSTIDDLLALPDDGKRYELHNGEIIEVGTSSSKHSALGLWVGAMLLFFVKSHKLGGLVTGADGTYKLNALYVKVPNAAYISKEKTATLPRGTVFFPFAPDLAVEIKSPSNSKNEMRDLALLYLSTGSRLVWTIDPDEKKVQVYRTGAQPFEISGDGELEGYDVLPGFKLRLVEMFAEIEGL
ncbi:MAG: Uma2 family endonuclease [Aggregatilineales bacterium]